MKIEREHSPTSSNRERMKKKVLMQVEASKAIHTTKIYLQDHNLRLGIRKTTFYDEGAETVEQVAQRGGGCS